MTPNSGATRRPKRAQPQPVDEPASYHQYLTRDEINWQIEQHQRIERDRQAEAMGQLMRDIADLRMRIVEGFEAINLRISMAEVDRQRQHEQNRMDFAALSEKSRDTTRRQDRMEERFAVLQAFGTLAHLVKKPLFWVVTAMVTAAGTLGTAIELWVSHYSPAPHVTVLPMPINTPSPATPTLPDIPAVPIRPTTSPVMADKSKVVGK